MGGVARSEAAENQLDHLIERRSRQAKPDPDEEHDLWKESVRRHNARRRQENRAAWYGWHLDQAERHRRTLAELVAHHEAEAEKLMHGERHDRRGTV